MDTLYDYRTSLGFLTATSNRLMSITLMRNFADAGLNMTTEQWAILIQLWDKCGITQEELACILCLEKSSLSRTLSVLERRKLIRRERDPDDARRKRLYTTEKANALYEPAVSCVLHTQEMLEQGLSEEEITITIRTLEQIKTNLRENQK